MCLYANVAQLGRRHGACRVELADPFGALLRQCRAARRIANHIFQRFGQRVRVFRFDEYAAAGAVENFREGAVGGKDDGRAVGKGFQDE